MSNYDLEERTFQFAKSVRLFVKELPKSTGNFEDGKQLIKSSGSIGANYIEANEKLGSKDLVFRMKIARKEAKESIYWIRLIKETNDLMANEQHANNLLQEAIELKKILSAIIKKL